jgi:hypothetical protein
VGERSKKPRLYLLGLLRMMRAPMIPGIQPQRVKIRTMTKEPHPLSMMDKGGNIIAKITLQIDILFCFG